MNTTFITHVTWAPVEVCLHSPEMSMRLQKNAKWTISYINLSSCPLTVKHCHPFTPICKMMPDTTQHGPSAQPAALIIHTYSYTDNTAARTVSKKWLKDTLTCKLQGLGSSHWTSNLWKLWRQISKSENNCLISCSYQVSVQSSSRMDEIDDLSGCRLHFNAREPLILKQVNQYTVWMLRY